MKNLRFFALAAAAFAMFGCDSYEPVVAGKETQSGDKACRIEQFVLTLSDDSELRGDVYDYDKSIDIAYDATNAAFLTSATAAYTLSEGATIAPDPASALDYTQPQSFTVTAPDGVTKRTYTTNPIEAVVETFVKPSEVAVKTLAELGTAAGATAVGVSGGDLVLGNEVFDAKTFAKKGDLNVEGVTVGNTRAVWLSNDDKGVLVGTFSNSGGYEGTTSNGVYAWKEGWDKAPTCILGPTGGAYLSGHLSITGDLLGGTSRIVASNQGGGAGGNHMIWTFQSGVRDNAGNYNVSTAIGAVWAQMVSPASTDLSGAWFGFSGVSTNTGNNGRAFTWTGWEPTPAASTPAGIVNIVGDAPGAFGIGNYNMGSVRSYTFNGKAMATIASTGWPSTYVSIVDEEGEFVLSPISGEYPNGTKPATFGGAPQSAYIYSEADNCGYIYVFDSTGGLYVWKIEVAKL